MVDELHPGKAGPITVGDLKAMLAEFRDDMPVVVEVSFWGGEHEGADLHLVTPEIRCDEIERLYLWGDQDLDLGDEDADDA